MKAIKANIEIRDLCTFKILYLMMEYFSKPTRTQKKTKHFFPQVIEFNLFWVGSKK